VGADQECHRHVPWGSPAAKAVMLEMLAEYKTYALAIFITEVTLYYDKILSKTGGEPPYSNQVEESCWALVTKLMWTIIEEVHKVRGFAAESVSFGTDLLSANDLFLSATIEELRVLQEFALSDWRNHPKFNLTLCAICLRPVSHGRSLRIERMGLEVTSSRSMVCCQPWSIMQP
jgi:hypothetical protein